MFINGIAYFSMVWRGWRMRDWQRLKPEERVDLAVNMSDVCIRVCAEGVKAQYPNISEEKLIELVRERLMFEKNLRRRSLNLG
ncbi:MAG: hypothetical protein ACQXXG_09880 [Candidatus Bathyarchaeia archaeon]|nr:hypothetical protein [Candidatus Bathyarchaeota archaeon A05DMB-3]